ncbi:MAG: glucosylglycerol hydrolase, partial [Anaerolineae bacterium]
MSIHRGEYHLVEDATQELVAWAQAVRARAGSPFEAAQKLVRRLGCHYREGRAEAGFWAPEVVEGQIAAD